MLRFVDIFAKVYPFSSTLLDSLDFFDSLSLSQTCRLLRDQTLENPLAFTNIDLRDKRAVGAIERYIERDRTRIQHASYLNGAAMHSILFETVNAHFSPYTPPKLFYDLSYAFEIQRLITIRVKVLKLDGLFINLPAMLSILKGIEPTIETLSMVSVRGVQLADFLELFTMDSLRWVKLKELKVFILDWHLKFVTVLIDSTDLETAGQYQYLGAATRNVCGQDGEDEPQDGHQAGRGCPSLQREPELRYLYEAM